MTVSTSAPTKPAEPVKSMTPEEKLESLEQEALALGMPPEDLEEIRCFGPCPDQILERIDSLQGWMKSRI